MTRTRDSKYNFTNLSIKDIKMTTTGNISKAKTADTCSCSIGQEK